ncbi:MAG: hypothetical protein QOC95_898 [Thermoleophilaceae bacterium]|jgi:hypothetical protein|nr:hypothetical protein [Thermoleophilaceae bacterium]
MLARRAAARRAPLAPSAANPDGRPTRPDKLSIWPTDDDRFGIDVLYVGPQGHRRAEIVVRQIEAAGHRAAVRRDGQSEWIVRLGPVSRDEMLAILNGYVW